MPEPVPTIASSHIGQLAAHLNALYPPAQAQQALARLVPRLEAFARTFPGLQLPAGDSRVDEHDIILITYGDQVQESGKPPLQSLDELLAARVGGILTGVHILPFYPSTSDDGFSVVDYLEVDPALGDWSDIERLAAHFRLMVDAVINHISASSAWFRGFLVGDPRFRDYFITVDPTTDLSTVTRPRALALLTPVEAAHGVEHVWTTFSTDQIDLNYANPEVLLAMTDVLLHYVAHGAQFIRLDAIAYLWKEVGTACIHLARTHRVVQFWRTVLNAVAPRTLLITETNVPHLENISYFGDGTNEAQLVYQFPLPPLTLHAFRTGDARHLQAWAADLTTPSNQTTFFNFLASHDGIGVRPAEGILSLAEVQGLVDLAQAHGGYVSYKTNPDGSRSPYELNINYFDALNDPAADEPQSTQIDRFMAAQAILLSLAGVPGIYVHSLFASRSWREGVAQTDRYRTINRQKFQRAALERELAETRSLRHQVFSRYRALIKARIRQPAFHPQGGQQIVAVNPALFSFVRTAPDNSSRVLCIHNVSATAQSFAADLSMAGIRSDAGLTDLISGRTYSVNAGQTGTLTVPPYGVLWLRSEQGNK
ncbi:MAG: alpha-amylase family glycosyl hydrolase [Ardenticatenaceae bacterium]|nr:alpha-amylase family glycosyl hydrolase [Ardenticatenaceae bacterium]HBY98441.1 sugar phosphorylase [Chloroflexota bacterium]